MIRFFTILTIFISLAFATQSHSRPIISGISTNRINIDTNFTGMDILLFGAKREVGDIIIVIRGPKKDYFVNKKGTILGVWYNAKRLKFENSYSYYSFFSTNEKNTKANRKLFPELQIKKDNIEFNITNEASDDQKNDFRLEFIEKLEQKELYLTNPNKIEFLDETLFKVMLKFPKNISRGTYSVEIYLVDDDRLSSFQSIPIYVNQTGFSAQVHDAAYNHSILYGLLAVFMAAFAGWLANIVFNKLFDK